VSQTSPKFLIIGPAWVGDMVLAQSLFKVLKQRYPDARIDVAAPAWTRPLLDRMPEVDEAIDLPFAHGQLALGARLSLGRQLRARRYDRAIVLPNSWKSALLPWAAKAKRRTGFRGELRYGLLNDIRPLDELRLPRTVDRFVSLALEPGTPLPATLPNPSLVPDVRNTMRALEAVAHPRPKGPVLALCPGAEYGPAKRWPAEHYADVANRQLDKGWEVWLFGSEKDIPVSNEIMRRTGARCFNLTGRTSLAEAIDLMSLATVVVSNDSGLMHVAAALGRPLVAIYGSSDPRHTPPMSDKATILSLGLSCSPCFKRECPLGHLKCLRDLSPARVLAAFGQ
jgi:heptosyltransferase-2